MAPKILLIDVETRPGKAYVWQLHKQTISVDQIIEGTSLLCFAAKWYGKDKVYFEKSIKPCGNEFDRVIVRAHALLSEADATITFNGKFFDIPRLNQEFARLGLGPTPPIQHIDLKEVISKKFSLLSNKLAFAGPYFEIGEKIKNEGWPLWIGCMEGNKESWRKMREYNINDVTMMEPFYKKLLPWIDGHPNMNLFAGSTKPLCTNCGSDKLLSNGLRRAATYVYRRLQCLNCGKWNKERKALKGSAPVRD